MPTSALVLDTSCGQVSGATRGPGASHTGDGVVTDAAVEQQNHLGAYSLRELGEKKEGGYTSMHGSPPFACLQGQASHFSDTAAARPDLLALSLCPGAVSSPLALCP